MNDKSASKEIFRKKQHTRRSSSLIGWIMNWTVHNWDVLPSRRACVCVSVRAVRQFWWYCVGIWIWNLFDGLHRWAMLRTLIMYSLYIMRGSGVMLTSSAFGTSNNDFRSAQMWHGGPSMDCNSGIPRNLVGIAENCMQSVCIQEALDWISLTWGWQRRNRARDILVKLPRSNKSWRFGMVMQFNKVDHSLSPMHEFWISRELRLDRVSESSAGLRAGWNACVSSIAIDMDALLHPARSMSRMNWRRSPSWRAMPWMEMTERGAPWKGVERKVFRHSSWALVISKFSSSIWQINTHWWTAVKNLDQRHEPNARNEFPSIFVIWPGVIPHHKTWIEHAIDAKNWLTRNRVGRSSSSTKEKTWYTSSFGRMCILCYPRNSVKMLNVLVQVDLLCLWQPFSLHAHLVLNRLVFASVIKKIEQLPVLPNRALSATVMSGKTKKTLDIQTGKKCLRMLWLVIE